MLTCPQCGQAANSGRLRLVQDSCGHRKCRECLLSDEASCWSCSSPVYTDLQPASSIVLPQTSPSVLTSEQSLSSDPCDNASSNVNCSSKVLDLPLEERTLLNIHSSNVFSQAREESHPESSMKSKSEKPLNSVSTEEKDEPQVQDLKKRQHVGLKEHIVFTPGDPPMYHCKVCRKSYNNRKAARYHNYCGLPDTFKPHKCDICGQGFVTSGHFSYHMKSHSGSLPFLCEICKKGFKQSSKLKRHMRSHEGEKPYKCDLCSRFFSAKHVLKDHMMLHSGNHILSCSVCSKRFSSKSCLRKHRLLHSDPTHKCDYCDKKFPVKWNLEMHRKTHLRERRYKCKQCNRAFKIQSDLKRHATVHLEDGEWICKLCKIVFRRKDNLVRHMKNIHPESQLDAINSVNRVKSVSNEPALSSDSSGVECSNSISEPSSSNNTTGAETSTPLPSQAVSVIRGRAVPVIRKMGDLPTPTILSTYQSSALTTHSASEKTELSGEFSEIQVNAYKTSADCNLNQALCSNSSTVVPYAPLPKGESFEDQPSLKRDQKFLRESVVCHSDARGIVHYGSVIPGSNDGIALNEYGQEITSLKPLQNSDVGLSECVEGSSSPIFRPRVIIEKVPL